MDIIDLEDFDKAFAEFQIFGPRRRIPIQDRWREVLPNVDTAKFDALKAQCNEIEASALNLAEQVRDSQIPDTIAVRQIEKEYPFLTRERLGHTWSQALYFSLK